jgi:hypothetical protein
MTKYEGRNLSTSRITFTGLAYAECCVSDRSGKPEARREFPLQGARGWADGPGTDSATRALAFPLQGVRGCGGKGHALM